jgi:hypothetical protein
MAIIEFVDRDVEAKKVDKKQKDKTKDQKDLVDLCNRPLKG